MKPKVIHVLYSGLGGHANVVFSLLETKFGNEYENIIVFFGVDKVLEAYITKVKELGLSYYVIQKKPKVYIKPFLAFKKILKTVEPKNVIVHNSELLLPALSGKCKVFYVEHENYLTKGRLLRFLSKVALLKSDGVVCLNQETKTHLLSNYKVKTKISIIPNGVNTQKFRQVSLAKSDFIVGMASRMVEGKDHTTLLNAFQKVLHLYPNIKLHIAGNGETLIDVKTLCASLDISDSVVFLGLLDEIQMLDFYQSLSVYVQATHSETLSTSILQAMSCGLPTIVTDIKNNLPLISNNETGWFYIQQNSDDLCLKLVSCIKNSAEAIQVGKNARSFIKNQYSNSKMGIQYSELLK